MSSLTQLLYTARDGLTAQSFGLNVTGQNVANVATPGYTRREALLQTRAFATQTTGSVDVAGLRRVTDDYVDRRFYESLGLSSSASEYDRHLSEVEALFNDAAGLGIGTDLDRLFSSFSALASNPSDTTTRAQVLAAADGFALRVRDTADSLAAERDNLLSQAQTVVGEINQTATQVARLNRAISNAEALGNDAADLKDQRHQLLLGLSEEIDVRTFYDSDGDLVVQTAGTTLVEGGFARSLSLDLAPGGALRLQTERSGGPGSEITQFLKGGKLAAIRDARDGDLLAISQRLDGFVFDVASAVNAQHAAGFGLDGVSGRALFSINATSAGAARSIAVDAAVANQPDKIAAADSAVTVPGGSDNAVLLAGLANQALASGGTRTFSQAYGDLVGDVGLRKLNAAQQAETRDALHAQNANMREALSGVSLDEEMVALTRFQRAYEASARVLTTVDQLLQNLLEVGR